jgi:hypothetical protein
MRGKDYIPRKEKELVVWLKNFSQKITIYAQLWNVPLSATDDVNTKTGKFDTALTVAEDPRHSSVDISKKNTAKDEATDAARSFYMQYIVGNKSVTEDQRIDCGLPVYDDTRTPADIPDFFPMLEDFSHPAVGQVKLNTVDSKEKKKTKPKSVQGVEVRSAVRAEKLEFVEEMDRSDFTTKTYIVLDLGDKMVGKFLTFFFRYENTRGQKGPWSPVYHIMIS